MTPRARKRPLLPMPAHTCQFPGCGQEYPSIGDFADTDRAALLGGWVYRGLDGQVIDSVTIITSTGRPRPLGRWSCPVHRDEVPYWPGPARPVLPVRVPGVTRRAEVIGVPVAAIENVPRPAARPEGALDGQAGPEHPDGGLEPLPPLPERVPQATVAAWQAAIRDQLNEKALKREAPLESLAPEPEEDETQT